MRSFTQGDLVQLENPEEAQMGRACKCPRGQQPELRTEPEYELQHSHVIPKLLILEFIYILYTTVLLNSLD